MNKIELRLLELSEEQKSLEETRKTLIDTLRGVERRLSEIKAIQTELAALIEVDQLPDQP